jgi:hexosaminidase
MSHYPHGRIYYTLNGTEPTLSSDVYTDRIAVDQSVAIKAALFEGVQRRGTLFNARYDVNKSTGKEVMLVNQPHVEYSRGGAFSLVDGVTGGLPWIPEEWLGFPGKNLDATINLGKPDIVTRVYIDVLEDIEGKIFLPKSVKVLLSDNGIDFKEAGTLDSTQIKTMKRKLKIQFPQSQAKYVKVIAENYNGKDWLFVDEIGIE